MRFYIIIVLILFRIGGAAAAELTLNIKGVSDNKGEILAVVCDKATFLTYSCPYKEGIPAVAGDVSIIFKDIPPGDWAALAFHDENSNKDLDRNLLGMPTEQFGFSNNPGYLHKPDFAESVIAMSEQNLNLEIQLSK